MDSTKTLSALCKKIAAIPLHDRGYSWEAENYRMVEEIRAYGPIASMCKFVLDNSEAILTALAEQGEAAQPAPQPVTGETDGLVRRLRGLHEHLTHQPLTHADSVDMATILEAANALAASRLPVGWQPIELHIVFQDDGGPANLRFVEVETIDRKSVRAGTWIKRDDGYNVLALSVHPSDVTARPSEGSE